MTFLKRFRRYFIDMKLLLPIIFLLSIPREFVLGKGIRRERSNYEDGLSYQELINMNISCSPLDSCMEARTDDPPVFTSEYKCSCHSQCWEYGTCCIDSPYRVKPPIHKCFWTKCKQYYMVHICPDKTHPDSIWRNHCEREVVDTDDILMITPVTSLDTSKTYKNYYCFRCHEKTDNYVSWNIDVMSYNNDPTGATIHSVVYNETEKTWVAILDGDNTSIPITLSSVFPDNVQAEPMACNDFTMSINCPSWADKSLHAKCLAYSAIVYDKFRSYKNVHCALCNGISIHELKCNKQEYDCYGGGDGRGGYFGRFFRCLMDINDLKCNKQEYDWYGGGDGRGGYFGRFFRCLMDINGGGRGVKCFKKDVIDKPKACKDDYHVWNPFTKKCQKTGCFVRGYVRTNDICVKP